MNPFFQALGDVGYIMDTPGAYLRGALSGNIGSRASGEDMLQSWGVDAGPMGGMAAEMVADPLMLAGLAGGAYKGIKGLTRGAQSLSHADDVNPLVRGVADLAGGNPLQGLIDDSEPYKHLFAQQQDWINSLPVKARDGTHIFGPDDLRYELNPNPKLPGSSSSPGTGAFDAQGNWNGPWPDDEITLEDLGITPSAPTHAHDDLVFPLPPLDLDANGWPKQGSSALSPTAPTHGDYALNQLTDAEWTAMDEAEKFQNAGLDPDDFEDDFSPAANEWNSHSSNPFESALGDLAGGGNPWAVVDSAVKKVSSQFGGYNPIDHDLAASFIERPEFASERPATEFANKLTMGAEAAKDYFSPLYYHINKTLRDPHYIAPQPERVDSTIQGLLGLLEHSRMPYSGTLHRGIDGPGLRAVEQQLGVKLSDPAAVGREFVDPAFLSTGYQKKYADRFAGLTPGYKRPDSGVTFAFGNIPEGKPASLMNASESEILFPPGRRIKITDNSEYPHLKAELYSAILAAMGGGAAASQYQGDRSGPYAY